MVEPVNDLPIFNTENGNGIQRIKITGNSMALRMVVRSIRNSFLCVNTSKKIYSTPAKT